MAHNNNGQTAVGPAILVADDDEGVRDSIGGALVAGGFQVSTVDNGATALGRLLSEPFDAAVVDLVMPGMSGASLIEELRRQGRDLPIILMSAYMGSLDQNLYRAMGAAAVFRKPFRTDDLLAQVAFLTKYGNAEPFATPNSEVHQNPGEPSEGLEPPLKPSAKGAWTRPTGSGH